MEVASSLGLTWGEKEIHAPSLTVCSNFRGSSFLFEKKNQRITFFSGSLFTFVWGGHGRR